MEKTKACPGQLPAISLGLPMQHGHSQKFWEVFLRGRRWENMMSVGPGRRRAGGAPHLRVKERENEVWLRGAGFAFYFHQLGEEDTWPFRWVWM